MKTSDSRINNWLTANKLTFYNASKTEFMLIVQDKDQAYLIVPSLEIGGAPVSQVAFTLIKIYLGMFTSITSVQRLLLASVC